MKVKSFPATVESRWSGFDDQAVTLKVAELENGGFVILLPFAEEGMEMEAEGTEVFADLRRAVAAAQHVANQMQREAITGRADENVLH